MKETDHLAPLFDPQRWFAHEGSLDPPSLLLQWRCLPVLRLERNPVGQKESLVLGKKKPETKQNKKIPLHTESERSFGNFKSVSFLKYIFRGQMRKKNRN